MKIEAIVGARNDQEPNRSSKHQGKQNTVEKIRGVRKAKDHLVNPAGMPTSHPADAPKETIPT